MPGHHWITAHDPAQGHIEVINESPLPPLNPTGINLSNVLSVGAVPVGKDLLSEGVIERGAMMPFPPAEPGIVYTIFVDLPPWKEGDLIHFHRTETVDIDVCIWGEITHFLPSGKRVVLQPGDSLVQRGTLHAWANLTDKPARMFSTLIGASSDAIQVNGEALRTAVGDEYMKPVPPELKL